MHFLCFSVFVTRVSATQLSRPIWTICLCCFSSWQNWRQPETFCVINKYVLDYKKKIDIVNNWLIRRHSLDWEWQRQEMWRAAFNLYSLGWVQVLLCAETLKMVHHSQLIKWDWMLNKLSQLKLSALAQKFSKLIFRTM